MCVHQGCADIAYAGCPVDRAPGRRTDPRWIAGHLLDARTRLLPLWRDHCLVSGDPAVPVTLAAPFSRAVAHELPAPLFLGLDGTAGVFAVDLSPLPEARALAAAGADRILDVRQLVGMVTPAQAATIAYARGLLHWNRHQAFCGTCGAKTEPREGGHLRACSRQGCARLHFPRIEPAVIMLVESAGAPRRCLLARHKASAAGGYSTLAGFVEIGESLEDAVRREVAEETGVTVGPVRYLASQPWPFPSGLMLGFRASAVDDVIRVDGEEITEARWFTAAELAEHTASGYPLGRPDSIDRHLLRSWLEEPDMLACPG